MPFQEFVLVYKNSPLTQNEKLKGCITILHANSLSSGKGFHYGKAILRPLSELCQKWRHERLINFLTVVNGGT